MCLKRSSTDMKFIAIYTTNQHTGAQVKYRPTWYSLVVFHIGSHFAVDLPTRNAEKL